MSDNASPTADLKILVQGTADCVKIKDKDGKEYKLQPLDLQDLCDYEDRVGSSLLTLNFSTLRMKEICYMLYLSLRKDGLSHADIDNRNFKLSESEMLRRFNLKTFADSAGLLTDLLRISGLDMEDKKSNPPKASQANDAKSGQ